MEIEFQLSKSDYVKFARLYLWDIVKSKRVWFLILTILLIFPISGESFVWWRALLAFFISPILALGISFLLPLLIGYIRILFAIRKDPSVLEQKKMIYTGDGLTITSESKTNNWKWSAFKSAGINSDFIYIVRADKKVMPIPKKSFLSESESINFLGLIQNKIFTNSGIPLFQFPEQIPKPNYRLGLLCLIPLIGAIAGIAFIFNGIFKYKDKWLVMIGVAGIVFTVGFYSALFYFTNSFGLKQLSVQSSQIQLNSLMKDVEFYKMKNGFYPDNLAQVNKDDPMAWYSDPLQSDSNDKKGEYNYQKEGDHYYLFSSGIDGIPYTKDDIYPEITPSDSVKFGWIKNK